MVDVGVGFLGTLSVGFDDGIDEGGGFAGGVD